MELRLGCIPSERITMSTETARDTVEPASVRGHESYQELPYRDALSWTSSIDDRELNRPLGSFKKQAVRFRPE